MSTAQARAVGVLVAEKVKLGLALVAIASGLAAFYLLARHGLAVQWGALVAGLALATTFFLFTQMGQDFFAFVRDAVREVKKVVWPERSEAIRITLFVFAFVALMALFLWLTDKTLEWVLYDLILGWRK